MIIKANPKGVSPLASAELGRSGARGERDDAAKRSTAQAEEV